MRLSAFVLLGHVSELYVSRSVLLLPLAFLCSSFAKSQAVPQPAGPQHAKPHVVAPSLRDSSARSFTWASTISSGSVRQSFYGGQRTIRHYDLQGRVIEVLELDPNGKPTIVTEYKYSTTGKLIQATQHGLDGDIPRVRTFVYDDQDRLISESSPEGGTVTYTYNGTSIASMTDARGITTTYIQDDKGHLIGKHYSNGDPSAVYVYDATSGLLTSSYFESPKGRFGERIYHYNEQGKLDQVTQKINGTHTLSFNYDASGHLTEITYPDGRVVHQTWDSDGHVSSIEDQNSTAYLSQLQYDANGNLSKGLYGNTLSGTFNYDSRGHIEQLQLDSAGKTFTNKIYTYTADGSISNISDALHPEEGFSYRYDALQRVAGYTRLNGEREHGYGYDAFGNLSINITSPSTYDSMNRITGTSGIVYDVSGDMTNDGRHRYQYDAEGRISRVDDDSVEYLYSAEGDRIQKRVGKDITETIWAGDDLLAELRPDGTWVDYLYIDGKRIAAIHNSDVTYYVSDPLGMTRLALSASGDILAQSDMTPFGQPIKNRSDAEEVPFTGAEQYDEETGLYSYPYRSYNPQLGRWMSPDPSDEEYATLGNPQSLNLYSYVINDPLKYVDPSGLTPSDPGACDCAALSFSAWAQQQHTPVSFPQIWGNYCGPNGNGNPIDALDAACQRHDYCYYENGNLSALSNFNPFLNNCQQYRIQDCNQALCNAANGVIADPLGSSDAEIKAATNIVNWFSLVGGGLYGCE
jgi:RHS repeat-associated protein